MIINILKGYYYLLKKKKIKFIDLTDSLVMTPSRLLNPLNTPSSTQNVIDILNFRKLPKFLIEKVISKSSENYDKIVSKLNYMTFPQYKLDLIIDIVKINFSSSSYNPMDKIYYYNDKYKGYHSETMWCKTEFNEIIIRCYMLGEITDKRKKENMEFWNLFISELTS